MVLLALIRIGDEAYGVPISEEIERSSGRSVALSSVYVALGSLSRKGLVASRRGEPTAARGGRAKTYFCVTAAGLKEARDAQRTLSTLWQRRPSPRGARA